MGRPTPRLQAVLSAVTLVVTTLALTIAGSLMSFSDYFHRASMSLADSVECIGLVDEAEADLLLYDRTPSPSARKEIEGDLRRRLIEARRYATSPSEGEALKTTELAVDRYLESAHGSGPEAERKPALLKAAYNAIDRLVDFSVVNARRARIQATHWESLAKWVAVTIGVGVLLFSGWLLWWLRWRAFRPVLALANSIESFAHGHRDARAAESGPGELRDMARRFNQMADALATQRQTQLKFLGGVAHDLRNPLTALRLSVALIKPDQPLPPEPKIRRTVALVERQIGQLERMVGDFLDMARIEAGQLAVNFQVCDARELVRETMELFEAASPQRELAVLMPPNQLVFTYDPMRLGQVLSNLVSNAIKYSPEGSRVEVSLTRQQQEVLLAVTDHGVGISEQDQRQMFEPFRRFDASKHNIPGVGLGLFVVRQIVRAHGGRIEVDSAPGRGTTVRVWLPRQPPTRKHPPRQVAGRGTRPAPADLFRRWRPRPTTGDHLGPLAPGARCCTNHPIRAVARMSSTPPPRDCADSIICADPPIAWGIVKLERAILFTSLGILTAAVSGCLAAPEQCSRCLNAGDGGLLVAANGGAGGEGGAGAAGPGEGGGSRQRMRASSARAECPPQAPAERVPGDRPPAEGHWRKRWHRHGRSRNRHRWRADWDRRANGRSHRRRRGCSRSRPGALVHVRRELRNRGGGFCVVRGYR